MRAKAKALDEKFIDNLIGLGVKTSAGVFQAMMLVTLENDGPVALIVESPSMPPSPFKGEGEGGGKLTEKLRELDLRGICREGLKAGLTSPEATILTYWSRKLPAISRQRSDLRIVDLHATETEARVVYEVTVGGRRLKFRDRLKLEGDGWRLTYPPSFPPSSEGRGGRG